MAKTLEEIKEMGLKVGDLIEIKSEGEYDDKPNVATMEDEGYFVGCYKSNYSSDYEMVITSDVKNISWLNLERKVILDRPEGVPMLNDVGSVKLKYIHGITKLFPKDNKNGGEK